MSSEKSHPQIDIEYFRRLHCDAVKALNSQCAVWDEKADTLQGHESEEGESARPVIHVHVPPISLTHYRIGIANFKTKSVHSTAFKLEFCGRQFIALRVFSF